MDTRAPNSNVEVSFKSPKRFLAGLDAATMARVISSAADVALIIDDGVVTDLALSTSDLAKEGYDDAWRGKAWIDTVTVESQQKIRELLDSQNAGGVQWRQVNHPSGSGLDVPIKYTTVKAGAGKRFVALGRDLRVVSSLQQRLMETHQGLEREFSRMREAEARYKVLFETMSEAVLIVDSSSTVIEELNPAAADVLQAKKQSLSGRSFIEIFAKKSQRDIERMVATALSSGKADARAALAQRGGEVSIACSAFLRDTDALLVVRLNAESGKPAKAAPAASPIESIIEKLPDGLVVTNGDLRIVAANRSFFQMAQLVSERQAIGVELSNWLSRSSTELNMLVSNLKNYGVVRNFATILRDRFGVELDVEVSAVSAPCDDGSLYGFSVRNTARRLNSGPRLSDELPSSVDQVTGLVGRMSLKEIVRESTDLIEKLCIETALDIADDNRASAAEILGLSRQGLYSKLKRFGIDDSV
ncbi:MAG: transcriptional regulator PpsR [Pseudomonadota bacterium]